MQPQQTINKEKQRLLNQNNLSNKARSQSISTEGQHELDINGIKVLFPFKPYDSQLVYMQKVIETLQNGSSALLESPTGTGKTLSLLCSVLAWTNHLRHDYQKLKEFEMAGNSLHKRIGIPNIIYSTRTHTQLNQCVQELKATAYHPRVTVLGSRAQLCVHPKISLEKGSKQNAKCRSINAPSSAKKCWFRMGSKHMNTVTKAVLSKHILDVEDLHLIGKDQGFCPYYHSIESCNDAEIIFMPYNYLVNPNIRPPSVNITGSIVIFDEAHNIESVCCDSVSFEFKAETLAQCISEVQSVLELNKSSEECLVSKEDLVGLKKILLKFEQVIEGIQIPSSNSMVKNGDYIFDLLKEAGITMDVKDTILDVAQDVLRELVTPEAEQSASLTMSTANRNANKYGLETFVSALQTIFSKTFKADSFKVHLAIKKPVKGSYFSGASALSSRTLSLWCFNPGVAISSLKNEVHAMILTSGTLSPLQSFSSELQIDFPVRLENKHLIIDKQVYVGVLEKGPRNRTLSSEYNVRTSDEYMQELGSVLINIARRIPFGMLVFFASYSHMNNCVEYWHKHRLNNLSIMEQLEKNKHVISEPRGGGQSAVKAVFEEYTQALKHDNGAMLLAVMRGKVSEGMDFADNAARCVVVAGIPYPYTKDPKVQAKRQYMDNECWRSNQNNNKGKHSACVNGQMWYQQQAVRAVNQAIGRVIRHRFDYGCIILADRRFAWSKNQKDVSKWVRPHIKTMKNFGMLIRELTQFFKNAKEFDAFMKKPKNDKKAENFSFIKVRRELLNISDNTADKEINQALDGHGLVNDGNKENKESKESTFKRYARKRKFSDTLGNMKRFISTPKETPSSNAYKRKRTMNIVHELNDYGSQPSIGNNDRNNSNTLDISFHGNTPMASDLLKRRMKRKKNSSQNTEINKMKAIKLRLQSDDLSQTNYIKIHNDNKRKQKQSKVLLIIKNELTKEEYNTFKSVLRLLSSMKDSNNQREFDENVVTPFRALFSLQKRQHLLCDLKKYIPKQFLSYYTKKLINENNEIILRMPINKAHHTLDDSFVKLRKIQDKNADVSKPFNKHKRKMKGVTKNHGFDGLCRSLMASNHYRQLYSFIKEWKGIDGSDVNVIANKKRILQNIVNVLIENCRNDIVDGHMTKFRSLSKAFDRTLTKNKDKQIYHDLIQSTDEMKPYLSNLYKRQMK